MGTNWVTVRKYGKFNINLLPNHNLWAAYQLATYITDFKSNLTETLGDCSLSVNKPIRATWSFKCYLFSFLSQGIVAWKPFGWGKRTRFIAQMKSKFFFVSMFTLFTAEKSALTVFSCYLSDERWPCSTTRKDPKEKIKSCRTSGRWSIRKSTTRNDLPTLPFQFPSYSSLLFCEPPV